MTLKQHIPTILQQHPALYGVPLRRELSRILNRDVAIGEVYAACNELERDGIIMSYQGEGTPERGGRRKLYWRLVNKP